jgi:hypothetical protein
MKSFKIISLILVLITAVSCSDFLIKEPQSLTTETYFTNETQLRAFLTGVYSPLMQESFYGAAYLIDISGGDDLSFYQRSGASGFNCANANSSNAAITNYWKILYVGIMRANVLLEHADKNTEIAEKVRTEVKAQALFLRSFYYYNLVFNVKVYQVKLTAKRLGSI